MSEAPARTWMLSEPGEMESSSSHLCRLATPEDRRLRVSTTSVARAMARASKPPGTDLYAHSRLNLEHWKCRAGAGRQGEPETSSLSPRAARPPEGAGTHGPRNRLAPESTAAFDLLRRQPRGLVSWSGLELKSLVPLGPWVAPNPRLTTLAVPHLLGQHGLSYHRGKAQGRRGG